MPPEKSKYEIIIAGQPFEIDWRTYTFLDDDPGFNAHALECTKHSPQQCVLPYQPAKGLGSKPERLRARHLKEQTLAAARAAIRYMVVHLDGCPDAASCFNVLHNERGLSCHFILDNDGILYQTCDLIACAYHAAGLNETSIGIEICNRGDARPDPHYYDHKKGPPRDVVPCEVNGHGYVAFDFTKPQYEAMHALGQFLARHLPGIKLEYPQSSPGVQSWATLDPAVLQRAAGYVGHYHLTQQKWDPGPFDFKRFVGKLAGKRTFPIGLHGKAREDVPAVPAERDGAARKAYDAAFEAYYDNNELEGAGGYFPVGPLDRAQLYHGGIHLRPAPGQPVVAPLPGKVIIARNGPVVDADVGSTSFVLLAHQLKLGEVQLAFWSLYMHLAEERGGERPKFMGARAYRDNAEPNRVTILDTPEPVQAGELLGHTGVGPGGESTLHWEIFSESLRAVEALDGLRTFTPYPTSGEGRFCTKKEIVDQLDVKKRDGVITAEELLEVYRGGDRFWARSAVTNHPSEWAEEPDWLTELNRQPGFAPTPARQRELERLVAQQILPTVWLTREVAERTGLPEDGRVFTYHPVTFLRWINDLIGRDAERRTATRADYAGATGKGQLDIDDTDGTSFVSAAELVEERKNDLTIEQIIDGYPEPKN